MFKSYLLPSGSTAVLACKRDGYPLGMAMAAAQAVPVKRFPRVWGTDFTTQDTKITKLNDLELLCVLRVFVVNEFW